MGSSLAPAKLCLSKWRKILLHWAMLNWGVSFKLAAHSSEYYRSPEVTKVHMNMCTYMYAISSRVHSYIHTDKDWSWRQLHMKHCLHSFHSLNFPSQSPHRFKLLIPRKKIHRLSCTQCMWAATPTQQIYILYTNLWERSQFSLPLFQRNLLASGITYYV